MCFMMLIKILQDYNSQLIADLAQLLNQKPQKSYLSAFLYNIMIYDSDLSIGLYYQNTTDMQEEQKISKNVVNLLYEIQQTPYEKKQVRLALPILPPQNKYVHSFVNIKKLTKKYLKRQIEWKIEQLVMVSNHSVFYFQDERQHNEGIVKSLTLINFPNLKKLSLANINIVTIEHFKTLETKFLKYLNLDSNKINNFNSLRKKNFYMLRKLSINQNPASGLDKISELTCINMRSLDLEISKNSREISPDINYLAKFLTIMKRSLDNQNQINGCVIEIKSQDRIQNKKLDEKKKNKGYVENWIKPLKVLAETAENIVCCYEQFNLQSLRKQSIYENVNDEERFNLPNRMNRLKTYSKGYN